MSEGFEMDHSVHLGKECIVFSLTYILSRVYAGATLADKNCSTGNCFAGEPLHTQSFRLAVLAVLCTAAAFFVCHLTVPLFNPEQLSVCTEVAIQLSFGNLFVAYT